jgi:hypothetical protein
VTIYPAITIWQPWASLIMAGAKPFEFRGWAAPRSYWGRRVAIHAGARPMRRAEVQELLQRLQSDHHVETGLDRAIALPVVENALATPGPFPRSAILCLATLGRPVRDAELAERLGLPAVNDSDRDEHSNWGWPLNDIEPLTPYVPAGGRQGWWMWNRSEAGDG